MLLRGEVRVGRDGKRGWVEEETSQGGQGAGAEMTSAGAPLQEEIVERRDACGRLLHPNLQRRLGTVGGYHMWLRHEAFDISQHVTLAPAHYQGRLLTSRNMQVMHDFPLCL